MAWRPTLDVTVSRNVMDICLVCLLRRGIMFLTHTYVKASVVKLNHNREVFYYAAQVTQFSTIPVLESVNVLLRTNTTVLKANAHARTLPLLHIRHNHHQLPSRFSFKCLLSDKNYKAVPLLYLLQLSIQGKWCCIARLVGLFVEISGQRS